MTEPFDMGALFDQAQKMADQMQASQAALAETEVEGVAGGGVVRVTLTGDYRCVEVTIDPAAVDPADVEMLEDLVQAALLDATTKVGELAGDGLDLGGLGLGGGDLGGMLGGLLGGGDDAAAPIDTTGADAPAAESDGGD